jgi:hypothetical protein
VDFGAGAGGLGFGDADGGVGQLGAKAAELEILGLKGDEVDEVGVHAGSFRRRL